MQDRRSRLPFPSAICTSYYKRTHPPPPSLRINNKSSSFRLLLFRLSLSLSIVSIGITLLNGGLCAILVVPIVLLPATTTKNNNKTESIEEKTEAPSCHLTLESESHPTLYCLTIFHPLPFVLVCRSPCSNCSSSSRDISLLLYIFRKKEKGLKDKHSCVSPPVPQNVGNFTREREREREIRRLWRLTRFRLVSIDFDDVDDVERE